ncbi:Gfo/Idh/MocA family protein [Fretibacter rubidus]|uniref:Gfo/Idh/MocA family protein n=1 Tax=Fretibacter rubidus TaxID=570162 RepID=UPI00352B576F
MISWGMIGCGDVTEVKSGPAFNITGVSRLYGVVSRTESSAIDYAKRHKVSCVFESVSELIASPDIDAVYIATPPSSHPEIALEVARAKKPCCIEKPIANSYSEAVKIHEAFQAAGTPLFVAYYRRSLPRFLAIQSWLSEGRIGKVRHIHWGLMQQPKAEDIDQDYAWRKDPIHAPGGYFDDLACHGLDIFDFFFGEITLAHGTSVNQQGIYDVPDSVCASWRHKSDITGTGFWNFSAYTTSDQVVIIGDQGKIVFSIFDDTSPRCETMSEILSVDIDHPKHVQKYHVESMIDHLSGRSSYSSTGESATRTAWVCEQILS